MQRASVAGAHALLSASSSHRWLHCTPSVRLEEGFENTSSIFAEEGTFMHELLELQLRYHLQLITKTKFINQFEKMKTNSFYSEEIYDATKVYVDYVIENVDLAKFTTKDAITLIEQRVDFSRWVESGFGTADTIIVVDEVLQVIDLKGGKGVAVSADNNSQMKLYALGALNLFDILYDIKTVRMTIVQPRLDSISTYEITAEELLNWAETELKPKAQLAIKGEGEFQSGGHCRFCRARQTCRARALEHLVLTKYEFNPAPLLSDDEIAEVMLIADRTFHLGKRYLLLRNRFSYKRR